MQGASLSNGLDDIVDSLRQALGVLRSFAIITIHPITRDVSMHPLAHAWARDRLDESGKQGVWACTASLMALSTEGDHEYQDFFRVLQPHIESWIDASPEEPFELYPAIEIGRMFYQFAWVFFRLGDYFRAKALAGTLYKKFDSEILGVMSGPSIRYLYAICLSSHAEFSPAQAILEDIVYSDKGTTGVTDETRLLAKAELAKICQGEGKYQVSVDMLREVVQMRRTSSDPDTVPVLRAHTILASALIADGQTKEAISLLREAIQIWESTLNPAHPECLGSQHVLAVALLADGKIKEAISLLRKFVQIRKSTLNPAHLDRLTSQHQLARALLADGKNKEAISLLRDVLQIKKSTLNPTHPSLLLSKQCLASGLRTIGYIREALEIIQPVVTVAEGVWEPSDERRIACEWVLRACLADKEKLAETSTAIPVREYDKGGSGGEEE